MSRSAQRSDWYRKYWSWQAIEGSDDHPALVAWRRLFPGDNGHITIEAGQVDGKSAIYRLHGLLPGGAAVIAKCGIRELTQTEYPIYAEILPRLPVSALKCYGMLDEPVSHPALHQAHGDAAAPSSLASRSMHVRKERVRRAKYCWLFLEDASGTIYNPADAEHRVLAGKWLGLLHTSAASLSAAHKLPERGPSWYLQHLIALRDAILHNELNPALSHDDWDMLRTVVRQCDHLECQWDRIEALCARMPHTLVHGDFVWKNIRVQQSPICRLAIFDWEMAGWGVPATDVAGDLSGDALRYAGLSALPDLDAYHATVHEAWPEVTLADIQRWAAIGLVFRLLLALSWASTMLSSSDVSDIADDVNDMEIYRRMMTEALHAAGLDVLRHG